MTINTQILTVRRELNTWEQAFYDRQIQNKPDLAEHYTAEIETMRSLPAPGPCPAWCEGPDGHSWDDDFCDGRYGRYHMRTLLAGADPYFDAPIVYVSQPEIAMVDGTITRRKPHLLIGDDVHEHSTAETAGIVQAFTQAYELMQRISAEQITTVHR